jgi:hypothetical protein
MDTLEVVLEKAAFETDDAAFQVNHDTSTADCPSGRHGKVTVVDYGRNPGYANSLSWCRMSCGCVDVAGDERGWDFD